MNKVILMGNLTRDPELSYGQSSNTAFARFSIAVNRRFSRDGEPDTDFFNCTAFGKTAEFVEKYFHKGSRMLLSGQVQNDNYTNKNGEKVYGTRVIVDEVEFGQKKGEDTSGGSGYTGSTPDRPDPASADGGDDDFQPVPDGVEENIPFFND